MGFNFDMGFSDLFGSSGSGSQSGTQDVEYSGGTTAKKGTDSGQNTTVNNSGNTVKNSGNETLGSNIGTSAANTSANSTTTNNSTTTTSGRNYNSGRTDVTQLMISDQGIGNMINTILQGSQGLASVSAGQHLNGTYDSTTNQMLVNDLLTRTAGYVAEKSAATVSKIGDSYSTSDSTSNTAGTSNTSSNSITNQNSSNISDSIVGPSYQTTGPSSVSTNTGPRTLDEITTEGPKSAKTTSNTSANQQKDGLLSWIICTELYKQGRFGYRQYIIGSSRFAKYDEKIKRGYYIWAVPSVHHLRKYPNSKYSKFLEIWFNARAEWIMKLNKKHYLQFKLLHPIAYYGTHAFCWILSRTIARGYTYDSSKVYGVSHG